MRKRFDYIAFYDLDHTIIVDNSATHLVDAARSRGIMTEKQYRQAVFLSIIYKLGLGNPTKMITRMLSWLKDLQLESIISLCQEVFTETLIKNIRPEILETMEEHRRKNGANVLLSSATAPICEPVVRYLELDDMICTFLEHQDGKLTGTTDGNLVYGEEKRVRLLAYCSSKKYDPATSYYYGDSFTDRYVMESVGFPVAVAPDRKLREIARAQKWPILVRER